jgi:Heterokaryon incompatibility protein (HET)
LLFHASLVDPPGYRALSYTWGKDDCEEPLNVLVEGPSCVVSHEMIVTSTCMFAISRLFRDDPITPIWIDAICIDQSNKRERNHQVGLMSRIYSSADKVQIVLGPGDENTHKAIQYVKKEFELMDQGTPLLRFPYTDHAPVDVKRSLANILSRPWFNRIWVLQEVHFSKYAEAICGEDKIPWAVLRLLGCHFYDAFESETEGTENRDMWGTRRSIPPILAIAGGGTAAHTLYYWMEETVSLQSTDPRDSVFALLGLASDVQNGVLDLEADYSKSLKQLRQAILKQWMVQIFHDIWLRNKLNVDMSYYGPNLLQMLQTTHDLALQVDKSELQVTHFQNWLLFKATKPTFISLAFEGHATVPIYWFTNLAPTEDLFLEPLRDRDGSS